jgi:hypothetical protein
MSDFLDMAKKVNLKSEDNLIETENGAIVYKSTGATAVDFLFSVNSLRNATVDEICDKFAKVYAENPLTATKLMFQIGDIREGKGERHTFNSCLKYMALNHPEITKSLLPLIPEYTRWDYAIKLCTCGNKEVENFAKTMVVNQINEDVENAKNDKSVSLCAKWMPSIQSKKPEDRKLALKLEKALGLNGNHKAYRKLLSELRDKLNIVEKNLSQKTVDEIDFSKMTSKQMLKYGDKMKEVRGDDFEEYLEKVAKGEEKMNSSVNTPADIVHKYTTSDGWDSYVKPFDLVTENLWKNLKDTVKGADQGNTIVIRDGSASMLQRISGETQATCLEVATALTIYCSEKLTDSLKNKFITFSSHPEIVDLSAHDTLHDKLEQCYEYTDCSNTDLKKTFDLLLNTLKSGKVSESDAPKSLLIVSDMEFDSCHKPTQYGYYRDGLYPLFDTIRSEWEEAGYKLPTLVFWQVNANRSPIPEIDNELGLVLLSGFTTENLDLVLSGELAKYTPEKQLELILSKERYDAVEKAFTEGLEAERKAQNKTIVKSPKNNNIVLDYDATDIKEDSRDDIDFSDDLEF